MIETHCHLDYLKAFPLDEIIQKSKDIGIEKIVTIAVEPDNFSTVREIAENHPTVYCTQGIHPHDASKATEDAFKEIESYASSFSKCVAVGEIGLDYHYDNSPRDIQREVFARQLQIATKVNKPVVIHTRDAEEDTKNILNKYSDNLEKKGVIHSFTSSVDLAKTCLDLGFYIGFNGIITFKNAHDVREVLANVPIDRILIETDSPFLTPVPHRGKENGPYFLSHVAEKIAEEKNMSITDVIKITKQNAIDLFEFK